MSETENQLMLYDNNGSSFVVEKFNQTSNTTFRGEVVENIRGDNYAIGHISDLWSNAFFVPYNPLQPHPLKDLIIAWANGETIQEYDERIDQWVDQLTPSWNVYVKHRIKPKDTTITKKIYVQVDTMSLDDAYDEPNLYLTFDADTKKLLNAEVIESAV